MKLVSMNRENGRCETGRKLILPRLATGRIFEAPEVVDNGMGSFGSFLPAA